MRFFHRLICGLLIGTGCVLPGVSGGVMAVSFGLYRPALDALLDFFHAPKRHLRFLLPIALGGVMGLMLGAQVLSRLMAHSRDLMLFLFMGFILGGVPDLWRASRCPARRRFGWMLLGLACTLPFAFTAGAAEALAQLTPVQAFLTGLLEGAGTIIPGVSTSMVLIRLGWYSAYLQMLSSLLLPLLACMGAGFALSALACMHAVRAFFNRFPTQAHSAVLGFLLGSLALVFPGFAAAPRCFAQLGLMVIGAVAVCSINQINLSQ